MMRQAVAVAAVVAVTAELATAWSHPPPQLVRAPAQPQSPPATHARRPATDELADVTGGDGGRPRPTGAVEHTRRVWLAATGVATVALPRPAAAEGNPLVTQSNLGLLFREGAVRGAQFADTLDLKWEKFSDDLRDKKACDPTTGRRVFDNGYMPDGSRRGNPVLGGLCKPVELQPVDRAVAARVVALGRDATLQVLRSESPRSLDARLSEMERRLEVIQSAEEAGRRAREAGDEDGGKKLVQVTAPTFVLPPAADLDEEQLKQYEFNRNTYTSFRAWAQAVPEGSERKLAARSLEIAWGNLLLAEFSDGAGREAFTPFSMPNRSDDEPYDVDRVLGLLGTLSACLRKFQASGLIGKWELSVPPENDFEVVTLAVDDDISLGAQKLLRDQRAAISGSAVTAMCLAVMYQAKVSYRWDSYFIDPQTTSRQETYEPSQLLVSFSEIKKP